MAGTPAVEVKSDNCLLPQESTQIKHRPRRVATSTHITRLRTGPGRHRRAHRRQRPAGGGAELEMRARGNGQAGSGLEQHRLLPLALAPPHLPLAAEDIPDLLDG